MSKGSRVSVLTNTRVYKGVTTCESLAQAVCMLASLSVRIWNVPLKIHVLKAWHSQRVTLLRAGRSFRQSKAVRHSILGGTLCSRTSPLSLGLGAIPCPALRYRMIPAILSPLTVCQKEQTRDWGLTPWAKLNIPALRWHSPTFCQSDGKLNDLNPSQSRSLTSWCFSLHPDQQFQWDEPGPSSNMVLNLR